jgi:putative membrane protein
MRYLSWTLRILLFLLLFGFALKNTELVTVHFYLGSGWEAPLALVLLVIFGIGAAAGVFACLSYLYRQRREILQLRKEARAKAAVPEDVR